ncbi:MAG: aminoacyl-tRNA hydrolase [Ruminococcus sp.]|nr:aminoacyl-tRNA hydrolase [Ruminococcus sp.]MCD7799744.1 aminoacyl-tRNA hydrolase [Ruminococcus sp.]
MSIFDAFKKIENSKLNTGNKPDYIIVGLGNPDTKYLNTRHNAGFMAIDMISKEYNIPVNRIRFKSLCGNVTIHEKNCLLMKPTTYMNNSGQAVVEAMNFYKVPIENVIVIYDDISLEPSKLRIRRKGSDGGHNGIKSIIYLTGADTFPRIKLGVGKKPHPDYNLADWVLSNFKPDELEQMKISCSNAVKCVELIVQNNIDQAMNKFNS